MRFRLWHRLFLAFAALSVLALAGFAGWQQQSFRLGFLGYLDQVALERLQPASTRLAAAYAREGSWQFLRDDPRRFGELIDLRDARRRGPPFDSRDPPPGAAPGSDARGAAAPPEERAPPEAGNERPPRSDDAPEPRADDREPPRGPPRPHGPPDLMPRLLLLDAKGAVVAGNPGVPADALEVAVLLDATRIGTLRLQRMPEISNSIDVDFARAQTRTALVAGLAVIVGALALAFALAQWLLAPVRALTDGTRALAAGDYARRIRTRRSDELGALADDFNHLAESLERHRESRRQWGADIAHELRTPLSVLRGEIQALQDGVRAPTAAAFDSLNAECERLGALIEDLYQLALADAGALEYRFESTDLADVVREAIALQRGTCLDAGLALEEALANVPAIHGDPRRLAQLMDNLIANARRYTDAPGRIRVELDTQGDHIELRVDDTPPGVAADERLRLFDRLYRVERSRNRSAGGAGLGLAICRAIVDAHGGRIDAQASPLGGLRIVVRWPIAPQEHA